MGAIRAQTGPAGLTESRRPDEPQTLVQTGGFRLEGIDPELVTSDEPARQNGEGEGEGEKTCAHEVGIDVGATDTHLDVLLATGLTPIEDEKEAAEPQERSSQHGENAGNHSHLSRSFSLRAAERRQPSGAL